MFIELVQGRVVTDRANLQHRWTATLARIADEAAGWLGATSGAAPDGSFLTILAFASEESARITMDRLHDSAAWDDLARVVADLRFRECPKVLAAGLRDPGRTDLVQVTQGFAHDIGRVVSVFERMTRAGTAEESVTGSLLCWDDAGFAMSALYRRSIQIRGVGAPDIVREEAATLFEEPARLDLVEPWSILDAGGLPLDEPDGGQPVPQ